VGSSSYRQGAAYLKDRFVIFKEKRVYGRARVAIDKNVCCDKFEQKSSRGDTEVGLL